MSVSGIITYGIGPKGSLQFLLLDGLALGVSAAPAAAVIGGMVKRRHSKRYEVLIDGVTLIGRSLPDLERKVAAWRAAHPKAVESIAPMREITPAGATEPSAREQPPQVESPRHGEAPGNTGAGAPAEIAPRPIGNVADLSTIAAMAQLGANLDAAQRAAVVARQAHLEAAADAQRRAWEDDDMDVLQLILEKVA